MTNVRVLINPVASRLSRQLPYRTAKYRISNKVVFLGLQRGVKRLQEMVMQKVKLGENWATLKVYGYTPYSLPYLSKGITFGTSGLLFLL